MTFPSLLKRCFVHPAAPCFVVVLLACSLCIPSLRVGLVGDDYVHRTFILGHLSDTNAAGAWWNLFDGRGPISNLIYVGVQPWWSSPSLSVAFFRPLSAVSQYIDYIAWPNRPWLMHAHNILLYVLIAVSVVALYRRLVASRLIVWIAALMYVTDDAHLMGTAWIASRNTLLTALLALLTIWLFDKSRRDASRMAAAFAVLTLMLAHASSEGAIAVWGYLVAYALFIDEAPIRSRVLSLAPLALVSAFWISCASLLGYGVHGSGAYLDPRADITLFVRAALTRLPDLVRVQFGLTDEIGSQLPSATFRPIQALVALLWTPLLVVGLRRAWRHRSTRFFLVGCILALVPLCAVGSIARLLFIAGFGAHGFAANLVGMSFCFARDETSKLRRGLICTAASLPLVAHLSIAILATPLGPQFWTRIDKDVLAATRTLPAGAHLANSTILIANTPDFLAASFVALYRVYFAMPGPKSMHILGVSQKPVQVRRIDQTTLEFEPENGYLADPTSILARRPTERFVQGQTVVLDALVVKVAEITSDGRPRRVRFSTADIDAPNLVWMFWDEEHRRYAVFAPPRPGESRQLVSAMPSDEVHRLRAD